MPVFLRKLAMTPTVLLAKPLCRLAVVLDAVWLAGCALVPIQPGAMRAEVLAKYGKPSAEVTMSAGTRLQ